MIVGICGLGLIGGSAAKAYKEKGHEVYGYDRDEGTLGYAKVAGILKGTLNEETLPLCELILIALYPKDTIQYLKEIAPLLQVHQTVMDFCGIKESVCREGFQLSEKYGFSYVGGHPMAGTQFSGIKYAKENLFKNAPMVIVPKEHADIFYLDHIKELLSPLEFGKLSVKTAKEHDEVIAFTSQLAHVVSNAYVKSPTAKEHKGISAGSYKDLTRVAKLNETMWADLFLQNKEPLIFELETLISHLKEYQEALENEDFQKLKALLKDGREIKEEIDGK